MRQDRRRDGAKHVSVHVPSIATTLAQSRKDRINAERERKGRKRARKQAELDLLLKAITPKDETDEDGSGGRTAALPTICGRVAARES